MKKKLLFFTLILFICISGFGQTVANQPPNLTKCQEGSSYPSFDLTLQTAAILGNQDPQQFTVKYFYWLESAVANLGPINNPTAVWGGVIPDTTTYYARVTNNIDNTYAITSFTTQTIGITIMETSVFHCDSKPLYPTNIGNYYTGPNQTGEMIDLSESEYIVTESGTVFYVHAEEGGCIIDIPIVVEFGTSPEISEPAPLYVCDENDDGIFWVDLTTKINEITNGDQGLDVTFHETPEGALYGVNDIPNTSLYMSPLIPPYTIYVNVTSTITSCSSVTSFQVDLGDCTENFFSGILTYNINNGCTEGAIPAANRKVSYTHNGNTYITFTDDEGNYVFENVPDGISNATATTGTFISSPQDYQVTMPSPDLEVDFCLTPVNPVNDISVTCVPIGIARPGQIANYNLVYRNLGTYLTAATIILTFDDTRLDFLSSSVPMVQSGNTLTLTLNSIAPFSLNTISLQFTVMIPPIANLGDVLNFTATITTAEDDENLSNNNNYLQQVIRDSCDPNDIAVKEGEYITEEQADDYLHYTIRFQNKGTAEAIDVRVETLLDYNLDWSTFEPITASHTYKINQKNNEVEFSFKNINLAFENAETGTVPESNGYIIYRIKPKASVTLGDIMKAQAHIYFDFNDAIDTNIVETEVKNVAGINENSLDSFTVHPNPASANVNLIVANADNGFNVTVIDMLGKTIIKNSFSTNEASLDISALNSGIYFINIVADGKSQIKKLIVK